MDLVPDAGPAHRDAVARGAPANPFATVGYARARERSGEQVCAFIDSQSGNVVPCFGFLRRGRVNRRLEIASLPDAAGAEAFVGQLEALAIRHGITILELNTFASAMRHLPPFRREQRRDRVEWVVDLHRPLRLGTNHRRNLKRAQSAGLRLERAVSPEAAGKHQELMAASSRRRMPGTADREWSPPLPASGLAFAESGAGEFFRVVRGDEVIASALLLRSPTVAYYHSAGASSEGLTLGAPTFLIAWMAALLREQGCAVLNLGGAGSDAEGLLRFKSGFGSVGVPSVAVVARPFSVWRSPLAALQYYTASIRR